MLTLDKILRWYFEKRGARDIQNVRKMREYHSTPVIGRMTG